MHHKVQIVIHSSLKDFLPGNIDDYVVIAEFDGSPAIKDTIESIGIPHSEIGRVEVNEKSVTFPYGIHEGDGISVFPVDWISGNKENRPLQPQLPEEIRFVLDVHLGKLARELRMLGFDCKYENDYKDEQILNLSISEKRIVLTRDTGLLKRSRIKWGHWMRNTGMVSQVKEVLDVFGLRNLIHPFSICFKCNGKLVPIDKDKIMDRLPPKVKKNQMEFHQCEQCGQLYWKGTHFGHMLKRIFDEYGIVMF